MLLIVPFTPASSHTTLKAAVNRMTADMVRAWLDVSAFVSDASLSLS
jgi:hypothetical protein